MLLPSIFGNDFFEDFMNFPTWDRTTRDANRELRRMEHEFNGLGGLMRTDVKESNEGYEANRTSEAEEGKKFLRRERYVGQVSRSFYVGELLTEEDIKARFENGVLMLTIPKKEEVPKVEEKRHIAIEG